MKKLTWMGIVTLAAAAAIAPGCNTDETTGDGDGDGDVGDGDGDVVPGSGGGPTGAGGNSTAAGGNANTGGNGNTGGNASAGGSSSGGMGGDNMGGDNMGGSGNETPEVDCDGCAVLYVPLSAASTWTDFEIDFGAGTPADLTDVVVTFRFQVVTDGNAGGMQFYAKNDTTYASEYQSWTDLVDAESGFVEVDLDLGDLSEETDLDPSAVRWVGLNLTAGGPWEGADWQPTYVFLDSITFSDGPDDVTFTSSVDGLAINIYNSPVAGSTVTHQP